MHFVLYYISCHITDFECYTNLLLFGDKKKWRYDRPRGYDWVLCTDPYHTSSIKILK